MSHIASFPSAKRIALILGLPELRIFWMLLPMLVAVFVLTAFELPFPLELKLLLVGVLLLIIASAVLFVSYSLAVFNFETKAERNELRNIITTINDALVVYDVDFKVSFFNPAAEKLFSLRAEEVMGKELNPKMAETPATRLLAQVIFPTLAPTMVYLSRAGAYPQVVDLSFDAPLLELRVSTSPITDEHGNSIAFLKLITDRTQETSLLRSKNEFITVASHQLRTPVTGLVWAMETLATDPGIPSNLKDMVAETSATAHKIQNLVEDLLDVAKIEEGHFAYDLQDVDLSEFTEKILAGIMPQVQAAGLNLYFERPPQELPPVHADPDKLSMVISNLLDNAVRYNVEHGQVIVRIKRFEKDPRYAQVSVEDSGIGIPSEEIPKTFTKFFRASNAVKYQTEGSGLGLWIVRNIVRAHGGEAWAESELSRGTKFYFTLPIDPAIVPSSEAANSAVTF